MTVFHSRPAAALRLLMGTVVSFGLAGVALAQAPAESWPFDDHGEVPPALPATQPQPKSAVQLRLEELYRRDGRPLPDYMQQDNSSSQAAQPGPAGAGAPSPAAANAPPQRNQRNASTSPGTVRQQLSDYYQSQGKALPAPRQSAGGSSSASTQNAANAARPAEGHWYDRINPFHKSTPAAPTQGQAQNSAPQRTSANDVYHSAPVVHEAAPIGPPAVSVTAQVPVPATPVPVAPPSSFFGERSVRRVPQQPSDGLRTPIRVELGPGGKLVRKTQTPSAPVPVVARHAETTPAAPPIAAVAPAIITVPADVQPVVPPVRNVPAANAVADEPAMPFQESSEADADQKADGPYSGLTLEDEQTQLTPPKPDAPKVATPAKPSPKQATAADARRADPARVAPVAPSQVAAQKRHHADSESEPGHVSIPQTDTGEPTVSVQQAPPLALSAPELSEPPQERAGHVSIPQIGGTGEASGPALPEQSEPQHQVAAQPARQRQSAEEKLRLIGERVGQRGLKGFCPVMLRDYRELIDANLSYCSVYRGHKYYLSSPEAQARFDAAPQEYVPVAGGLDVVVKVNSDQAVEGSLDFALWYRGRLYLFCSPESVQAFSVSPAAYAAAVQRTE